MINLRYNHIKRIQSLYRERFNLLEIHLMYNEIIPYKQLRARFKILKAYCEDEDDED